MNHFSKLKLALAALLAVGEFCAQGQGAFQNLNFEAENIPSGTQDGSMVALTAWTPSTVHYDDASTGGALVTINDLMGTLFSFSPLQGNYSVILWAGSDGSSAISQTGLVPATAQSIRMDIAYPFGNLGSFTVTLGGQTISMVPLQSSSAYTVYGGNISAEANQTAALTIQELPPTPPNVPPSSVVVDDIVFSPMAVPEPSIWALMACGAGLLGVLSKSRKL